MVFYGKEQAYAEEYQGQEIGDTGSGVHEKSFRYNIDEHVRGRVKDP